MPPDLLKDLDLHNGKHTSALPGKLLRVPIGCA